MTDCLATSMSIHQSVSKCTVRYKPCVVECQQPSQLDHGDASGLKNPKQTPLHEIWKHVHHYTHQKKKRDSSSPLKWLIASHVVPDAKKTAHSKRLVPRHQVVRHKHHRRSLIWSFAQMGRLGVLFQPAKQKGGLTHQSEL